MKPRFFVKVTEYFQDKIPNYSEVGKKIDNVIQREFFGPDIAVRYLSLQDHPNLSLDKLVEVIEKTGTDKYDPERKMSVAHDFYHKQGVDMFAVSVVPNRDINITEETLKDFNEGALEDRGYSLKIDIVVVYDANQLEMIPIKYDDGIGEDAFKFKYPEKKSSAVLGFVILSGR